MYQVINNYPHHQKVLRASWSRTVLITISTWWLTLKYSVKALLAVSSNKESRLKVDAIIREWSQALVDLSRINILVKGDFQKQYQPGKPYIIMCNHSSAYDIPVSFLAIPGSVRMLAKRELFKIPLFGQAMKQSEFIAINRQDKAQAKKDLLFAQQKMEDGIILWIAPEGTRSVDGNLLPLKKGGIHLAIQTGAMIIPVGIKDIHKVLPTKSFRMNLYETVEVRIGEGIDASQYSFEDRNQLTQNVKTSLESLLSSPIQNTLTQ